MRFFINYNEKETIHKVTDENLGTVYTFTKVKGQYNLLNDSNQLVGSVKKSLFSKAYKIITKSNGKDKLIEEKAAPIKQYKLEKNNLLIKPDITYTEFIIFNSNNEKIFSAKATLLPEATSWNIEVLDSNLKDLCMTTFIAMRLILTK